MKNKEVHYDRYKIINRKSIWGSKVLLYTIFKIAIVGNKEGIKQGEGDFCAPCAVCRQVMAEFCDLKTFKVIIAKSTEEYLEYTLEELLPLAFTGKDLD